MCLCRSSISRKPASLSDVLRLQGDYLRQTLERMVDLNRRLELAAKTWSGPSAS